MTMLLFVLALWFGRVITAEDWEDVGNCGAGLKCGPECQRLCLIQHNYYRSLHNSPPLKCDPKLAKSAQDWADSNAFDGAVQRSNPTEDFVESISWKKWGWQGMATREGAIPAAVRSWYSEIKNGYNFDTGKSNGTVTHFKSVVHSHETTLGCGINIKPGDGTYVVAHYGLNPTDKYKMKDFTPLKKVGRRNKPDARCDVKSTEREQCGNIKSPFVTPDKCIQAGCCYDDIFLDEPGLQWHNDQASTWCFKRKDRMTNKKPNTSIQKGGSALGDGPAPTASTSSGPGSTSLPDAVPGPPSATANCSPGVECTSFNAALGNVIAIIDTVTKLNISKGNGQASKGAPCFNDSCYSFEKTGGAWTQNRKTCKVQNGDLVSMETEDEWTFINKHIQDMTNPTVNEWHIGLKKQGGWKWVSGKPLTIKKWQRGQPSGDGTYAVMAKAYPPGSQGLFNDLPDWIPRGFICEFPKGGVQPGTVQPTGLPPLNGTTQPTPIQPGSTQPGSTKPGSTKPGSTQPGSTQPGSTQPGSTKPGSTQPGSTQPGSTKPGSTKPGSTQPGSTQPGSTQPSVGATTALPTSPVGGNSGGMKEFEKDCLKAHNEYRAKHGTPPLTWSKDLQEQAQKWANYLATINDMKHDMESIQKEGVGENLAFFSFPKTTPSQCQGPKKPDCAQCREMVADWYAEEPNFDYSKGESKGGVVLHFTQIIWKDTKELGMATATSNDKFFTVARYKPRGNMGYAEDYKTNVPPVQ